MKLIPVTYNGFTAMDRRFSSPMLPWIVSEIRKREYAEKLSVGIEDGCLQAYNADFEVQFSHRVVQMTRFSQADLDPCTFLYLLRDDIEQLLYCYLFQASKQTDVSDLYQQMKEHNGASAAPVRPASSTSNLTSLCVDISPSSSNFFEVLYIGKIKVWHKKVPDTFIDDALTKFRQHDIDKNRRKLSRLRSEMDLRRGSVDSIGSNSSGEVTIVPKLQRSLSLISNLSIKSPDIDRKIPMCIERITESTDDAENGSPAETPTEGPEKSEAEEVKQEPEESDLARFERQLKQSGDKDDHNRTMVLQVDRTDLRLISPDRKVILLHKQHKDVTTCIQGITSSEHFGFIAREGSNINTYIGYVFKCESTSVTNEAVAAISQAFNNVDVKIPRPTIASCDHCPMVWYHKLCSEVENLTDRKTQAAIFRKIDQMDEDEQNLILTKFRGAETDSLREQNEFLMMLLRAHCEMKQGRHMHDSVENRSEFLNQYLGSSTIFMKAKRSLTNSFDHLLKRRPSKDDFGPIQRDMTLPVNGSSRETSPNLSYNEYPDNPSEGFRSRSSTVSSMDRRDSCVAFKETAFNPSSSPERRMSVTEKAPKSPMMDIFFKVGSSPKLNADPASWRQTIFKRVVTPGRTQKESRVLTKDELRALWKKAIYQAILLVRMEKENARIRAKQEESAVKRIKLEYDELRKQQGEIMEVWDLIGNKESKITSDNNVLSHAIRQGVPRGKRGEVWQFLAEQFCAKVSPIDLVKHPNYGVPYETLLKQLTSHQHAILIDLGRTFPAHSYFSSPLGPGQLALFNLLKAYSLLDPEVGYCQGLSFVAGVLLLHMEESQAFFQLRHLMYRRGLRQQYLPDMVGLQVKLYQLSRLLHDHLPDLYAHLDEHEVAPTLYAAPWLLTIFASQFPLGFVTRVFDLIFLENTDVIFRVVLALLTLHKESILSHDSFEDIMNYFKNKLPAIDKDMLEKIIKEVYTMDISKQLNEYSVEYFVLQEEIQSVQLQVEAFQKMETQNRILAEQNKALLAQLEVTLTSVQRLEKNRAMQQSGVNKMETQVRSMEVTISTLANFINHLIDSKANVNIPGEVRRIVSQISFGDRQRSDSKNSNIFNMFRKNENRVINPNKLMVKSLSTGRIALNNNNNNNDNKKLAFFSNSHKDIIDQKLQTQMINRVNDNEKGRIINDYIMECSEKSLSPTNSIDSGICTPVNQTSPTERFPTNTDRLNNNRVGDVHPLSNCDISFTYNTRELKKVKSIRDMSRNTSPDVVN